MDLPLSRNFQKAAYQMFSVKMTQVCQMLKHVHVVRVNIKKSIIYAKTNPANKQLFFISDLSEFSCGSATASSK